MFVYVLRCPFGPFVCLNISDVWLNVAYARAFSLASLKLDALDDEMEIRIPASKMRIMLCLSELFGAGLHLMATPRQVSMRYGGI